MRFSDWSSVVCSSDLAVKLMRGAPKTPITLTIMRADNPQPVVVHIVRDIIKVRSVRSKMLDNGVAYVRIAQFQEKTGADLARQQIGRASCRERGWQDG